MIRSKTFLFPIPNSLLEIVERFSDDLIIVLMMNIAYSIHLLFSSSGRSITFSMLCTFSDAMQLLLIDFKIVVYSTLSSDFWILNDVLISLLQTTYLLRKRELLEIYAVFRNTHLSTHKLVKRTIVHLTYVR